MVAAERNDFLVYSRDPIHLLGKLDVDDEQHDRKLGWWHRPRGGVQLCVDKRTEDQFVW